MILAVLQARVSSSRLPGKVLAPVLGKPMLALQLERVLRAKRLEGLVLATSTAPEDDPLEALARDAGVPLFRGSLHDVLDRFYRAAAPRAPGHVVRLTGDCPLADPLLIDEVVSFLLDGGYDYASNSVQPTFPDGLDVEAFSFAALERAWREATLPSQREHVTPFLHTQPDLFRVGHYKGPVDLSSLRWTVDEPADLELVRRIYTALYPSNPRFTTDDVYRLLERHPDWNQLNGSIERNEGLKRSLAIDARLKASAGA